MVRKLFGIVLMALAFGVMYLVGPPEEKAPIERWLAQYVGDILSIIICGLTMVALLAYGVVLLSPRRS